jgi:hypothetical protein
LRERLLPPLRPISEKNSGPRARKVARPPLRPASLRDCPVLRPALRRAVVFGIVDSPGRTCACFALAATLRMCGGPRNAAELAAPTRDRKSCAGFSLIQANAQGVRGPTMNPS